jgi:hypothetical protein
VQVVYNLKHIRHLIGTNSGDGFVRFTGNNALQCQPAVFHDVVNRGNSLETVVAELAARVDLEICLTAISSSQDEADRTSSWLMTPLTPSMFMAAL